MANSEVFRFKHSARTNPEVMRALENGDVRGAIAYKGTWCQRLKVGEFTGDADGDQTIAFHTYAPHNLFPANVFLMPGHHMVLITAFAGGTVNAATAEVGDTNDPNGLITASGIWTGVAAGTVLNTPSAAEYALRYEAAYEPNIRLLTTAGNVVALTAGELEVRINFLKLVDF